MSEFWSRVRKGRLFQVLAVYVGASWVILQVADALDDALGLPAWVGGASFLLLLAGLVVVAATAWIQSHPLVEARARAEEVPHAWEFDAVDLRAALTAGKLPHLTWARALAGGGIVFLLLFGFAGLYVVIQDRGRSFLPEPLEAAALPGLAIMPFEVRGEGLDVWREGMVDLLSTNLDGVAGMRGIDSRTVLARWRERVRGDQPDLAAVLDAARATGARLALVGTAVRLGPQVRLSAELYDLRDGRSVGSPRAEGPADSVLALVDRLSIDVVRVVLEDKELGLPGGGGLRNVTTLATASLPAVQAYLEGEASFRAGDFSNAIDALERALAADSLFVLPLARLVAAYGWAESIFSDRAREYSERALRHLDRLPPRDAALVRATHQARSFEPEGVNALERLSQRYPDSPEVWYQLGDGYFHVGQRMLVPSTEAQRAFDRAIALDSTFGPAYIHPFEIALARFDTARAAAYLESYRRHAPQGSSYREAMGVAYRLVARSDSIETIIADLPTDRLSRVQNRLRFGAAGARAALHLAEELQRRPTRPAGVSENGLHADRVRGLTLLGRIDEALEAARPLPSAWRAFMTYPLSWFGVPLDPFVADTVVAAAGVPILRTIHAADRGRWDDYARFLAASRDTVAAMLERGDSTQAATDSLFIGALVAYGEWRRGRAASALEPMTAAYHGLIENGDDAWPVRVWLGEMLLELDRPADALRYFTSVSDDLPFALLRVAETHEALGNVERAIEAYAILNRLWQDADPDLPHAAAVRRALERLSGEA